MRRSRLVESHIVDSAAAPPLDRSYRFGAINGLRAYAALWVVLDHALRNAGVTDGPFVATLLDGAKAVRIFIVISGFVITHLILMKSERYDVYLGRRFFRLFPLYFLICVVGYFATGLAVDYANAVSWAADPQWAEM